MIQMCRQDNDLVLQFRIAARDETDDVAALRPAELCARCHRQPAFQRDGAVPCVRIARHGLNPVPAGLGSGEQLGRAARADRRKCRRAARIARAGAIGLCPGDPLRIEILDQPRKWTTASRTVNRDGAGRALARGDRRLRSRRPEKCPFLSAEPCGCAGEERDDLSPDIDPAIVVVLVLRGIDSVTDKYDRRGNARFHRCRIGARHIILTKDQPDGIFAPSREPDEISLPGGAIGDERHLLQITARIAARPQSRCIKSRCDILRGDVIFRASRFAPLHRIRSQEKDMCLHRSLIRG